MNAAIAAPVSTGGWRALSATLVAGAAYDSGLAFFFLFAPSALAGLFDVPLPGEALYLRLVGIFLVVLAVAYTVAARDPERFRPFVAVAILARVLGFLALALSTVGRPDLAGLWPPALADLAFAGAHLAAGRGLLFR